MRFSVRRRVAAARRAARRTLTRTRRRLGSTPAGRTSQQREPQTPPPALLDLAASAEELEVTSYRGHFVVARQQADVTVWRLAADTATAVAAALERAGVQYFAMHLPHTRVARWGVRRDDLAVAVQALADALGERGFYYGDQDKGRPPRLVTDSPDPVAIESLGGVTVFQYVRCTTTQRLYGAPDGCRIAVWDHSPGRQTLMAPDRGGTVQEIDALHPLPLTTRPRWDGMTEPILASTAGDAAAIEFPVDAVYLWVDDSDPAWRAKRAAVRARLGLDTSPVQGDASVAAHHFRDRGELRASMRSLETYAPWIRHIYLVTDDQCPSWLDVQHGRVTVVDHTEIFADPDALPTFNSHAIGPQVHRIPGLSEHYLLMNDDVMFNGSVTPYDFFTPTGQLKISFSAVDAPTSAESSRAHLSRRARTPLSSSNETMGAEPLSCLRTSRFLSGEPSRSRWPNATPRRSPPRSTARSGPRQMSRPARGCTSTPHCSPGAASAPRCVSATTTPGTRRFAPDSPGPPRLTRSRSYA